MKEPEDDDEEEMLRSIDVPREVLHISDHPREALGSARP